MSPKLSSLNDKHLLSHTVSGAQEPSLLEWFCVRVSNKVVVKLSVTCCHLKPCLGQKDPRTTASRKLPIFTSRGPLQRAAHPQGVTRPWKWHTTTSAICCQSHRTTLVQCGRKPHKGVNNWRQGSVGAGHLEKAGYHEPSTVCWLGNEQYINGITLHYFFAVFSSNVCVRDFVMLHVAKVISILTISYYYA